MDLEVRAWKETRGVVPPSGCCPPKAGPWRSIEFRLWLHVGSAGTAGLYEVTSSPQVRPIPKEVSQGLSIPGIPFTEGNIGVASILRDPVVRSVCVHCHLLVMAGMAADRVQACLWPCSRWGASVLGPGLPTEPRWRSRYWVSQPQGCHSCLQGLQIILLKLNQ